MEKTALSLHIGVNQADASIFPGAAGLMGPENDADAMADFALFKGFTPEVLKGPQATYDEVVNRLQTHAQNLSDGDFFLFTFSGHGTAEVDIDGDESDNQDEAILLFDRLLFDDELRLNIWPNFRKGVRVLLVADSCHAGTVLAKMVKSTIREKCAPVVKATVADRYVIKTKGVPRRKISTETRQRHLEEFRTFYESISVPLLDPRIEASILLLAACGDLQTAADGINGAFTAALLKVLRNDYPENYPDLIAKVTTELASIFQIPVLTPGEPPDVDFINEEPFTI